MYGAKQFFTVTGQHLEPSPECIATAQTAIDALWARHFTMRRTKASSSPAPLPPYADRAMIQELLQDPKAAAYWNRNLSVTPQRDATPSSSALALAGTWRTGNRQD